MSLNRRRGVPPSVEMEKSPPLVSVGDFWPKTMLLPSGLKVWPQ
jgi:hypothetical protein